MAPVEDVAHEFRKADRTMGSYLAELQTTDADLLDFGCGAGGETIWVANHVRSVTGVDLDAEYLAQAQATLSQSGLRNCRFVYCSGTHLPFREASFDAVFSTDTFEHVMDLETAFSELYRVLRPGGRLISRFGPLFYSPLGYHLRWACQVPWAHLVFGLEPVLELRADKTGIPSWPERTWQDTGLNGKRFHDFRGSVQRAGFDFVRFRAVPVRRLTLLSKLPWIGDFFTFGIDMHVRRPAGRFH
jgi:SAM-dependent methyltransferase